MIATFLGGEMHEIVGDDIRRPFFFFFKKKNLGLEGVISLWIKRQNDQIKILPKKVKICGVLQVVYVSKSLSAPWKTAAFFNNFFLLWDVKWFQLDLLLNMGTTHFNHWKKKNSLQVDFWFKVRYPTWRRVFKFYEDTIWTLKIMFIRLLVIRLDGWLRMLTR